MTFGVHSEVGRLRNVMVHRPGPRVGGPRHDQPHGQPARKPETMIMEIIYPFHSMFAAEKLPVLRIARSWSIQPGDSPGQLVTEEQRRT